MIIGLFILIMLFVGAADKLADRGMAKSGVGMHYAFVDCLPHCLSDCVLCMLNCDLSVECWLKRRITYDEG